MADRVKRLNADAKPAWGKFNASGMLAHINDSYRMALGELYVKPKNLPIRFTPIKQLVIYVAPFPKGAPTAPELLARCDGAILAEEQQAYTELLARLARQRADTREKVSFIDASAPVSSSRLRPVQKRM